MKKNFKILFFVNSLSFFLSHRLPIAEALKANGNKVIIAYGECDQTSLGIIKKKGFIANHIKIDRGGMNPFKELVTFFLIWKYFKKEKPDIVHLITIKPYLYGGIVAFLLKIKCVVSAVSGLGYVFSKERTYNRLLLYLLFPLFKLAFAHPNLKVIFQNKNDKKTLIDWGVVKPSKVVLIQGSGVNMEYFTKLNEPHGLPTVCFASRLLSDKGIYEFISAAEMLTSRGVRAKFLLAGSIDNQNPKGLKNNDLIRIKQRGIIEYIGFQKDIPKLFSNSHIICLPSSYGEGLPKVLIEAGAACRAIITTDTPGCRDAIIPNKTGLLVPIKNPQKLSEAIQWLIENPSKRKKMGVAGRRFVENNFQIEMIVDQHLQVYKNLIHI